MGRTRRSRERARQRVENLRPAVSRLVRPFWPHHLVRERQHATVALRLDLDGDTRYRRIVFRHAEGEDEPPRPRDLEIVADMFDVLAIAPIDETEGAADPRIDG